MRDLTCEPPTQPFCVLLAGGKGTRLHELTEVECKPAVPFAGCRLIDFTMSNALKSGVRQILVATQYLPMRLEQHLNAVWKPFLGSGLRIRDGAAFLPQGYKGTADAVRANLPEILASGAREVLILSADHVYEMDYRPMIAHHRMSGAKVTVAVDKVPLTQAHSFGVVAADGSDRITAFAEKPRHPQSAPEDRSKALVNLGIYVFDTAWLAQILAQSDMDDFGNDVLPQAVASGMATAHRAAEAAASFYWRDVGTLHSYRETLLDFVDPLKAPFRSPILTHRPSRAALNAAAQGTVLMPNAQLSTWARVHNAIIAPGAVIPAGAVIGEDRDEDRRWFRVVPGGTVLVTAPMLARWRSERMRPVPVSWDMAPARGA